MDDNIPHIHIISQILIRLQEKLHETITDEKFTFYNRLTSFYLEGRYPEYRDKLSKLLDREEAKIILEKTKEERAVNRRGRRVSAGFCAKHEYSASSPATLGCPKSVCRSYVPAPAYPPPRPRRRAAPCLWSFARIQYCAKLLSPMRSIGPPTTTGRSAPRH
ncbi:MAG: HEPN domain-containing protein [Treponema sp.]|nr:HEPN domain-containing protein [Treponema sp.]